MYQGFPGFLVSELVSSNSDFVHISCTTSKKQRLEDAILQAKQEKAVPEIVKQIQSVLPEFEGTVRERNQSKKKSRQERRRG